MDLSQTGVIRKGQVMIRSKAGNWCVFCLALLLPGSFVVLPILWLWRRQGHFARFTRRAWIASMSSMMRFIRATSAW